MFNLREICNKINISGKLLINEPMSDHTTFKTGGPADILAYPINIKDIQTLYRVASEENIPVYTMGGGANILVADSGIRGIVINTSHLNSFSIKQDSFKAYSGLSMSIAAWETGTAGLAGLHYFYAMPGTLGGAIWMNARCYGKSISETLEKVTLLSPEGEISELKTEKKDFGYKVSPFQQMNSIIVEASFTLERGVSRLLSKEMREYEADRNLKGHFKAPSAGSVFKNNRSFGKPSGKIVDEVGLKGAKYGGAVVSPEHGNIIFNAGGASSSDIRQLIANVKKEVFRKTGFLLEEEILYAGAWEKGEDYGLER
ncbi:MAG: UDP-N-acetylmuramate dehydrogenase [Spirochaetales bacterium]|nr:UDP-N-acetylmuramate dehydrogenase [Spirochaetales bacterium]